MLLEVRDIHVFYGNIEAIKGVSLEIREGEIVTLIGANGAGKTTTLNTISGLLRPRSGSISYAGRELAGVPAYEVVTRGLSQSPEGRKIFPRMSVRENLEMGAFSRPRQDLKADFERVFDLFPVLRERESQPGGTLSGGEQQMLAMGRALMAGPKLLMLDEPSMGLAPMLVERIFDIIREINAQGTTILLVEQNAHVALEISNRGYVLETGTRHAHRRRLGAAARSARARGVSGRRLSAGPPPAAPAGAGERGPRLPLRAAPAQQHERHRGGVVDEVGHRHRLVDGVRLGEVAGTERHRRRPGDPGEHRRVVPRVEAADAAGPPDVGAGGQRVRHDRVVVRAPPPGRCRTATPTPAGARRASRPGRSRP